MNCLLVLSYSLSIICCISLRAKCVFCDSADVCWSAATAVLWTVAAVSCRKDSARACLNYSFLTSLSAACFSSSSCCICARSLASLASEGAGVWLFGAGVLPLLDDGIGFGVGVA